MPVSVMFGNSPLTPGSCGYLSWWHGVNTKSVPPFVAFTITKGEGAFYFCVVCIFPNSHLYFGRSLYKNDLPQEIREVLNLFNGINVDCIPNDIQAIHRLPSKFSPKPTIIRFTHRSTVENIFKNKNKPKHLNTLNLDINGLEDSKIFICPSMCPYFKSLT